MGPHYAHSSVKAAEETLDFILDIISDGVWDWTALNGRVERSPGWYRMLGYDVDSFAEDVFTWENVIHPEDYSYVMEHFESYLAGDIDTYNIQYRCKKADGSYLWIEDKGRIVERNEKGELVRMIGAHTDINEAKLSQEKLFQQNELLSLNNASLETLIEKRTQELKQLNEKLEKEIRKAEYNASYDVLTNIYNRRIFEEIFLKELSRAKRYSHPLSVILLDIDEFKRFNDAYGHKMGDQVLCAIADLLKQHLRESDTLARWGGEEFIFILPNIGISEATEKAETIRQMIENTLFFGSIKITCSFGVTAYNDDDSSDSIFVRADKALYSAKAHNRNNVKVL